MISKFYEIKINFLMKNNNQEEEKNNPFSALMAPP
jgi:hypothetical protein